MSAAIAFAVVALALAVCGAASLEPTRDSEPPASPAVGGELTAAPSDRTSPGADDDTPPAPVVTPTGAESVSARIADLGGDVTPAPTRLRLPSLGIDAPILAVGQNDGALDVPDDVEHVAWYEHGPVPGEAGSAVLAAHVDLAGAGPGVFFRLRDAQEGDLVEVVREDGSRAVFTVTRVERHLKEELPVDEVFARDGEPRLALITCGGAFDASTRRYADNIVVVATPVG